MMDLAFVVGAAEEIARIGDLLVHTVLGGAVPVDGERARLLHHRTKRKSYPGGDDALHAVDLLLLHELAETLDGVLGRGLLFNDKLNLASCDAATRVKPVGCPLGGTDAVLSRRGGNS
jgi:hypothetical protein